MYRDLYRDMYYDMAVVDGKCCVSSIPKNAGDETKPVERFCCVNDYFSDSNDGDSDEEAAAAAPFKRRKGEPILKYNKIFRTYAFAENKDHKAPHPQCMICGMLLPNNFMKLRKLRKHFMNKHEEFADKPPNVFEKYLAALRLKQANPE